MYAVIQALDKKAKGNTEETMKPELLSAMQRFSQTKTGVASKQRGEEYLDINGDSAGDLIGLHSRYCRPCGDDCRRRRRQQ